jgi:hypothetical protein
MRVRTKDTATCNLHYVANHTPGREPREPLSRASNSDVPRQYIAIFIGRCHDVGRGIQYDLPGIPEYRVPKRI